MNLYLFLPIAGTSVSLFLLLGMGLLVGFLSGLFGVGGGFLLTPLLIMIGIPPTVAAASDSNQIVAASSSGILAHYRMGNVDFKMGSLLLIGGILGGVVGVQIIKILRGMGNADFLINITYVVMLGLIGIYMFQESLTALKRAKKPAAVGKEWDKNKKPSVYAEIVSRLPLKIAFEKSGVEISCLMPLGLGILVGILAGIMGVGGGFIMVPIMVYLLRMPMHVVVGTSLFQIYFTCFNVTIMQAYMNHTVDFILALVLLVGSAVGAQIGARAGKRLKADQLKILLACIILVVMIKMLVGLLVDPNILLSYKGGH
ncbi:MAG: sulfite exporter TauE/SafE family protein [Desulfobacteraceae bacterium]|nr:MAG: sulfite exporter TauE/SafE family protein [Desulfobacteraceae bacterium]